MMDGMDDLVTWLRAQLDDEKRIATDRGKLRGDVWTAVEVGQGRWEVVGVGGTVADHLSEWEARHIADHDPARVLREVEAKRRILARHAPMSGGACDWCWGNDDKATWPCADVRDVASAYSDRPGYREERRP